MADLKRYRTHYAVKQKYRCAVCDMSLANAKAALDHCHSTGMVRATLCATCNRVEGKFRKVATYMARKDHMVWTDHINWLREMADYLEHHQNNPSNIIHPTFDLKAGKQLPTRRKKRGS